MLRTIFKIINGRPTSKLALPSSICLSMHIMSLNVKVGSKYINDQVAFFF